MFYAIIAVVAFVAAGIASVSGFGIGSLLTPLLASQYGMKTAVGVVAIPHAAATALRLWKLRADVDRRVLFGFGGTNAGGALLGALLHARARNPILVYVLGILLVFAGVSGVAGYTDRMHFGRRISWIAGALSGMFGGLVGNQGGIRSAAMLGLGIQGAAFVATTTAIGIAVDAVRLPIYLVTDLDRIIEARAAMLAALGGVIAGTLLGAQVLRKIPQKVFRRVVSAILLAIGMWLLTSRVFLRAPS